MLYLCLAVFLVLLVVIRRLREIRRRDALSRDIPGPPLRPIVGNLFQLPRPGPDELRFGGELLRKYGTTVKLWLGGSLVVFVHDPLDVEVILKSSKEIRKSSAYAFFSRWLGTGLLTSTGEKWLQRRKAITPTFHFNILEQFTEVFNKKSSELVRVLSEYDSPIELDAEELVSRYTIDVVCETAMGFELNAIQNAPSDYISSIRKICAIIASRYLKPIYHFEPVWALFGDRKAETQTLKTINNLTEKIIKEREREILAEKDFLELKSGKKMKSALLEKLIRQKLSGNPSLKTYDDISEEVNTFLFEGHDTTASGISFALEMLARHVDVQERVYNEIVDVMGEKTFWTIQDLQKLTYLERVIKETVRLYPPVAMIARKLYNDVQIPSGYTLPANCTVAINLYWYHRNATHFEHPEEFNPDNFLLEASVNRHPYAYIPFSAGPRNCIGQKYAMLGMKTAIGKIVKRFQLSVVGPRPIIPYSTLTLRSEGGHRIVFQRR